MRNAGITVSYSPGISVTPANGTFIARNGYGISYRVSEDMCAWGRRETGMRPQR